MSTPTRRGGYYLGNGEHYLDYDKRREMVRFWCRVHESEGTEQANSATIERYGVTYQSLLRYRRIWAADTVAPKVAGFTSLDKKIAHNLDCRDDGCQVWFGERKVCSSIVTWRGKVYNVRHYLWKHFYHKKAPKRLFGQCGTPFCVNPEHCSEKKTQSMQRWERGIT